MCECNAGGGQGWGGMAVDQVRLRRLCSTHRGMATGCRLLLLTSALISLLTQPPLVPLLTPPLADHMKVDAQEAT